MSKLAIGGFAIMATMATMTANATELKLAQEWDKTFPKSDKVEHCKATFKNRFGITLAADVYKPMLGNGERNRPLRGFATRGEANTPSEASAEGLGIGEW